jgi:hypothetical protein
MRASKQCRHVVRVSIISVTVFTVSIAALSLFVGCGDDKAASCPTCGPENTLVFTREDSTEVVFPSSAVTYVWCGEWEEWDSDVGLPALRIAFGSRNVEEPNWYLEAALADIELDQPISFPATTSGNEPRRVLLFLNDGPNELSSFEGESGGTITFHALPFPGGGTVEFTIDAVLGSEYGNGPPVAVNGYFRHGLAVPTR